MPDKEVRIRGAVSATITSPTNGECVASSGDITVEVTVEGTGVLNLYALVADHAIPAQMEAIARPEPPTSGPLQAAGPVPVTAGPNKQVQLVTIRRMPDEASCQAQHHSALNVLRVWLQGEPSGGGAGHSYASDLRVFYAHPEQFGKKK